MAGATLLGFGLIVWSLWPKASFGPMIQLPDGISLAQALQMGKGQTAAAGWYTNQYCLGQQMGVTHDLRMKVMGGLEKVRYEAHELVGRTLCQGRNPAGVDHVTPRLGECFQTSGEKYLYAKEFGYEVTGVPVGGRDEITYLGFVWGGTNRLRHARDRIALIEDGIRQHGIFGIRLRSTGAVVSGPVEYLPTNQCAIIRDAKGLVKIVPLDSLKSYVDAGLVKIPN